MIHTIINIFQIVIGLPLALFVPGYLITLIAFKRINKIERIGFAILFSIIIDILIALFLGYNKTMKELTGGITALNLWMYLSLISIWLFIIYIIKKKISNLSV